MERYLVFFGAIYYPAGGTKDLLGDYESIEQAKAAINKESKDSQRKYKWAHIYDASRMEIIFEVEGTTDDIT